MKEIEELKREFKK